MAVYREGYSALETIGKNNKRIWPDACDFGAPTKEGDLVWKSMKQLTEWYGIKPTREVSIINEKNKSVSIIVSLMDEWAVSDGRKTEFQATEFYKVTYHKATRINSADGFVTVEPITNAAKKNELIKLENTK